MQFPSHHRLGAHLQEGLLGQRANALAMMYLSSALSQAIVSPIARTKQGYVCILVSKHTLMPHVLFGQLEIYLYICDADAWLNVRSRSYSISAP